MEGLCQQNMYDCPQSRKHEQYVPSSFEQEKRHPCLNLKSVSLSAQTLKSLLAHFPF